MFVAIDRHRCDLAVVMRQLYHVLRIEAIVSVKTASTCAIQKARTHVYMRCIYSCVHVLRVVGHGENDMSKIKVRENVYSFMY